MKPIILSENNWRKLIVQLHYDYPTSVLAIREKTKRVLGFTTRSHQAWVMNEFYISQLSEYEKINPADAWLGSPSKGYYEQEIHLDFYNEAKRTFFLVNYLALKDEASGFINANYRS